MTELMYARTWAVDDIVVRSGGDGRTVEAYAAVFDTPAEIHDQHGHYIETIDRSAFNMQIGLGLERVGVYFNHAMTAHGTPSDVYSVPIGRPVEIRPDGRGLRTVTRYNNGPDADRVLEAIRNNAITGYSFRGGIYKSDPPGKVRPARDGNLPTVRRLQLGLTEYGPTPNPAYVGAGILAVRSAQEMAQELAQLDADVRAELVRMLSLASPETDQAEASTSPEVGPGTEDQSPRQSGRLAIVRARQRMDAIRLGVHSGTSTQVLGDRRGDGGPAR